MNLGQVIDYAKSFHESSHHGWDHVRRVRKLALRIGEEEGVDLEVLEIAAYLHDIMREEEMECKGDFCHAEQGARKAREFLKSIGYDKADEVAHCIRTHRFDSDNVPQTLEAKVLYDADKIDSIGAVGIGRAYSYNGAKGSPVFAEVKEGYEPEGDERHRARHTAVHEYEFKLKKVKDKMFTKTGRRIAEERDAFMKQFFERLEDEVKGKK